MRDKSKKAKRKDAYGNVLLPGEYYSASKDSYEYKYKDIYGSSASKSAKDINQLRTLEDEIRNEKDARIIHGSSDLTVNELIELYLNSKKKINISTLTGYWNNYHNTVEGSWFGHMVIKNVLKINVSNFYNELILERGFQKTTVDLHNNFISPAFRLAVDSRWLDRNPCTLVMKEVIDTEPDEKIALSRLQQHRFIQFVKDKFPGYYNLVYICVFFGIRVGELLGMTESELDFKVKKFSVNHQLIYKKMYNETVTKFRLHPPKTSHGERYMFFHDEEAEKCLHEQIEFAHYIYDTKGRFELDGHSDFLFVTSRGKPYTPNSINRLLIRIITDFNKLELANAIRQNREADLLPHLSAHNLRHTGLTRMAESGMSLQTLQFVAGHSHIETTMNIYVHASKDYIEDDSKLYANYSNDILSGDIKRENCS